MKRFLLLHIICVTTLIMGCGANQSAKFQDISKETKAEVTSKEELTWQTEYAKKLTQLLESGSDDTIFSIRDLDNDSVPELVLQEQMQITVYTFSSGLVKMGNYDFGTASTRLLVSDDLNYPGIFFNYTSGGLEHYGYVSIEDCTLNVEELWNEDFSGMAETLGIERNVIEEISDNQELIKLSREVCSGNNDLIFEELNTENLNATKAEWDEGKIE